MQPYTVLYEYVSKDFVYEFPSLQTLSLRILHKLYSTGCCNSDSIFEIETVLWHLFSASIHIPSHCQDTLNTV